jgi:hypothetical protein
MATQQDFCASVPASSLIDPRELQYRPDGVKNASTKWSRPSEKKMREICGGPFTNSAPAIVLEGSTGLAHNSL